ncbi:MAG: hypothetical protein BGO12_19360 [Verrucomicrobia bacterium 61-8]|nr:MAG: hypothetical protein BGO12_19360 [Verrucomicrobia bacterium 61-8]
MADRTIRPYAAEAFPKETGDPILTLSCVRPERTFWEKAALIHEQNVRSGDRALAARQARHLADLVQLWRAGVSRAEGFASLFEGVKHHRQTYFDYKWVDYDALGAGDLKIVPPDSRLAEWRADYEAMRAMFHGEPPGFDEMVAELCAIEERLSRLAS